MYESFSIVMQVAYWFVAALAVVQLVAAPFFGVKKQEAFGILVQMSYSTAIIAILIAIW